MTKLLAVDPEGCGCTECLVGEYRPLDSATVRDLRRLVKGKLSNHTGWSLTELKDLLRAQPEQTLVLPAREVYHRW